MNKVYIPWGMMHRVLKDPEFRRAYLEFMRVNHRMWTSHEFAFSEGRVMAEERGKVTDCFMFQECEYSGDEEPEQGRTGFVFQMYSGRVKAVTAFYFNISLTTHEGEPCTDWYVEPYNDAAVEFFNACEKSEDSLGYVLMAAIPFDIIQRKAMEREARIRKITERTRAKAGGRPGSGASASSAVIPLSGGITWRYEYDPAEPHEPRRYARHAESWAVRGHYRHLRSGKVVYVRPHVKGGGRLKDTRYKL